MNCLVIIDCQSGFLRKPDVAWIPDAISCLVQNRKFDHVVNTIFQNKGQGFFTDQLRWNGCLTEDDLRVPNLIADISERSFVKSQYSCFTPDFLRFVRAEHIDNLYFVGVDTDACVLASAFDAANHDIPFEVLEEYCASSGGEGLHAAALQIIRRNLFST